MIAAELKVSKEKNVSQKIISCYTNEDFLVSCSYSNCKIIPDFILNSLGPQKRSKDTTVWQKLFDRKYFA